jgi:hypothetical protein
MVDPRYRGLKLARRLYEARKEVARDMNLGRIIIGGRIPGYGAHADELSAREYVENVMDKSLVDPVLTAQLANGFMLKQLVPNYFPGDSDSRGYATFLEWTNLDYSPRERRQFRAVAPVRIAVVQYEMRRVASFEEFGRNCEYFIDVASDYKSDFVLFPELVTNQLLSLVEAHRPGLAARELARFTEPYLELFTRLAIKYDVNVIGGSHFTAEDDLLYNVSYLFRRDGTIGKQYNLHITPNERRWWGVVPGDRMNVRPFKAKPPARVYWPQGCLECRDTGYLGRVGIYELLPMSDAVKALVKSDSDIQGIRQQGMRDGMRTLRLSGAQKVGAGITTIAEVLRVAPASQD